MNGRYFHASNLHNWTAVAKPVRGSTAKHKGKAQPIFTFAEGKCEVSLCLLTLKAETSACRLSLSTHVYLSTCLGNKEVV